MNFLNRNTRNYKHFRLLGSGIRGIFFGKIKPLSGYLRYLTLENKLENVDLETLRYVMYHSGFNIEKKVLYTLSERACDCRI